MHYELLSRSGCEELDLAAVQRLEPTVMSWWIVKYHTEADWQLRYYNNPLTDNWCIDCQLLTSSRLRAGQASDMLVSYANH